MTSPSKNIPNMDEIMDAIQKVLEEHDVGQARVVLELFDEVDRQKGLSVEDGGHDDYYNNQPYHQQQQQQLVNLEGIQGDGPIMKSPKPQPPPPRPVSHSDRRTHMANAGGAGPAVSTKPQWLNNLQPLSPTGETKKTTTAAAAAPHAPNTMTFGSTDARRPDEDLDSTVKELASTSRPDTQQTSPSKAAAPAPRSTAAPTLSPRPPAKKASASPAVASTPISNSNITPTRSAADERRRSLSKLNTTPDMNATPPELSPEAQLGQMAMGGFNPAEMLPEEMFRTLAKQQDRNERVRILKSFVGKSVLLDDKKLREQTTANPPAKMFLTDITRGNPPTSVPPPNSSSSKALPNLPRSTTTTTTTTPRKAGEGSARTPTTAAARGGALASNKATRDSGSSDSQDSTLPRINSRGAITSNVGKTVHTPGIHTAQTFTDTCRDNAKRAAKMNVGLTNTLLDRQSPTTSPRAGGNRGGGGGGGKSLQEMLQEQEELDRQNQAGLEKHTKIMSEARKFLARVEDNDDVRPHLEVLRAQRALDGPSQIRSPRATSAATSSTSTTNNNNTASRPNTNTTTTTTKSSAPNWTNRTTTMTTTTTTTATSGSNANGSIRPMNGSNNNTTKTTTTSVTSSTGSAPGITPGTSAQPPQHLSIHPQPPVSPTRTATGSRRDSNSPRQSTIQVVRFTMPQEPQAKREVMEQLQRSSAGQQHVSSKDRFSTLLAEQQRQLDAHQATDADYQKLIQKAEEYNKSLNA